MIRSVRVYVPGSIGNVGPGFDVLGLAIDGIGDVISLELSSDAPAVTSISGRDADLIPRAAHKNCAVIAAQSLLRRTGIAEHPRVAFERQLPLSGGLGSSAAASVAGAFAAAAAVGLIQGSSLANVPFSIIEQILEAALDGEEAVAGRHLDNIAPAALGGLCLARGIDPVDAIRLPLKGTWWLSVISPDLRLNTKDARAVLPPTLERRLWVEQMANTVGVAAAFATADYELMRRSLHDGFAEPRRAPLISNLKQVKAAASANGALACSISGAGPSIFALCCDADSAHRSAIAMQQAFLPITSSAHIGTIDPQGVRLV